MTICKSSALKNYDLSEFVSIRRDIHAHPELSNEENRTSLLVRDKLELWGLDVNYGLGGTGVVGTLRSGTSERSIGLRADMDALPITEENDFYYRSIEAEVMHACGHDGHTAMLLGAACQLSKSPDFNGIVHFIFQPAEESGSGAKSMMNDGLFEKFPCEAIFGLHNWPDIEVGTFAVRTGAMMASCNEFKITVNGKGAHAALPHQSVDPIFATIQIANGLQGIITRRKNPIESAVLSITKIVAGNATNVIPDTALIAGTVRTFDNELLDKIESAMRDISLLTASAHGCTVEFEFVRQSPATINEVEKTKAAIEAMKEVVGIDNIKLDIAPTMGAEDFSYMLEELPGCYAFIGNSAKNNINTNLAKNNCNLHNPNYDFNDDAIPIGISYWVKLVESYLK